LKKRRDAADAAELVKQEAASNPLKLTPEQILVVKGGLPDVLAVSLYDEQWWTSRLGI
jgi:hypothetical protein